MSPEPKGEKNGELIFSPSSSMTPVPCVYLTHGGSVYIGLVKHRPAE